MPHRAGAQEPADPYAKQKTAIRQAAQEYVAALNRGDAEVIAAMWTADGDFIDESGRLMKGREFARGAVAPPEGKDSVSRLAVTVDSLRFLSPEIAIEDGTAEIAAEEMDDSTLGRYSAVWVHRDGKWLLDSVRQSTVSKRTHRDWLLSLGWMIGEWREDAAAPRVEMTCSWSQDKNFLLREIRVRRPDGAVLSMTQRIGWDPSTKQIRAWTFGSDGSFGEAVCTRSGQSWNVAATGVTSDGESTSSTNSYTRINDDTILWESTEGTVGGNPLPDAEMKLVRKAAAK